VFWSNCKWRVHRPWIKNHWPQSLGIICKGNSKEKNKRFRMLETWTDQSRNWNLNFVALLELRLWLIYLEMLGNTRIPSKWMRYWDFPI
jgi:hypothetical protein